MALAFWLLSSVGSGSADLWAVEVQQDSNKTITYNGRDLPIVSLHYKPAFQVNGSRLVDVSIIDKIPNNAEIGSSLGCYFTQTNPLNGVWQNSYDYLIYNPELDIVYLPALRDTPNRSRFLNDFVNSHVYRSYEFLRNPPISVLSSEGLGGRLLVKLQAYILAGLSLGFSLYVLWIGYRAIDNFLYGVHKTYMRKKSARYIKSVMDENGGDPLGGSDKSSRSGVDPSIEFPPPR